MKLTGKLLSFAAVTALALGAICLSVSPVSAQGKGKGKPSFAGKPGEKMGKGGRSEEAREHAKGKGKKGKKEKKAKKNRR
jgi:hypothetical protein